MHKQIIRRVLAPRPFPAALVLALIAATLSACASQVRVSGAWQDEAPRGRAYTRILVVGVSPDVNERCAFEYVLAEQINKGGTSQAIRSCDAVTQKSPLTLESIEAAVASKQADAVLATGLVAKGFDVEEGGTRDTQGGGYYKATGAGFAPGYYGYGYGMYGVPVVYGEFQTAPSLFTLQGEVQLTTRLYDTTGPQLVYVVDTVAHDLESRDEGLALLTAPIADRLRKEGLIR